MSALTHMLGALGALVGLVILLSLTWDERPKMISLTVYGISMVLLYASSSLFHGVKTLAGKRMWLNRLDHVAVFLLIAGTYTPIIYNLFPRPWHVLFLATIWLVTAVGIAFKVFSRRIHGFFNASIYPILAWAGVLPAILLYRVEPLAPLRGIALLLLGGLIYMAGFLVYYGKRPDPWPEVFGHHEIWHLFVLGGSLCHFVFMVLYVVPA
jgi:hemolysin III